MDYNNNNNFEEPSKSGGCLKVLMFLVIIVGVFVSVILFTIYQLAPRPSPKSPPPSARQSANMVIDGLKNYKIEAQLYLAKLRPTELPPPLKFDAIEERIAIRDIRDSTNQADRHSFFVTDNAAWVGVPIRRSSWEARTEVREMLALQQGVQLYGSSSLDLSPLSTDQRYRYRATDDVIWMLVEDNPKYLPSTDFFSEVLSYVPRYVFKTLQTVSFAAQQYLRVNSQDAGTLLSRNNDNLPCLIEYLTSQDIRLDLVTFRVSKNAQLWAGHNLISADTAYRRFLSDHAQEFRLYGSSGIETPPDSSRSENNYKQMHDVIWVRIPSNNTAGFAMDASEFIKLCRNGSPEEVERAIQSGTDIHERNREYDFLYAAARENPEVVAVLLKHGVNVKVSDGLRRTVLMEILHVSIPTTKNNAAVIPMLLEAGAELNVKFSLHDLRSVHATPEVVRALISHGSDVNAMYSGRRSVLEGSTFLIKVARGYEDLDMKLIPVLLDMGADANIQDKNGKRAIDYAEENKLLMENTEIYQRLTAATSDDVS